MDRIDRMIRIAVVIPFYQRKTGILTSCLRSIAAQCLPDSVEVDVIIVNDDSPIHPDLDIASVMLPRWVKVRVLAQANGGPAAARNLGLDAVPSGTDFLAFIDSDDRWAPDHLASALEALREDADFFFCDSEVRPGLTEFEQRPLLAAPDAADLFDRLPGHSDVFTFRADDAAFLMTLDYMAHTSTVVYRWPAMADLRFVPALRYAGEDHLMWVLLANRARAVCFSTAVRSYRGEGINLYRDALTRISNKNIRREACRARAFSIIAREPGLPPRAATLANRRVKLQMQEIARIMLHPAGLRAALDDETRACLATFLDRFWLRLPLLWAQVVIGKMTSRFHRVSQIRAIAALTTD